MKRYIFLLLVTLITSCTFKKYQVEQPNFVIIYLDDVGYGDLGCYGALDIKTPRVDLMAKEGIRFTDFYTMPICGPSRATLMTGRYLQRQHGGTWLVPPNEFMLSEALKTVDYATACIGKWDMSHRRPVDGCIPNDQGFDYFFGTLGANDGGRVTLYRNKDSLRTTRNMAELTQLYTDEAIQFIEKQESGKPFFLYLAHTMAHSVIDATSRFKGKSEAGLYGDVIEELDWNTGRLLDALDKNGFTQNTIVLFASDNGPWSNFEERLLKTNKGQISWGSPGPLRGAKGSTWEGGERVPAILWGPGYLKSKGIVKNGIVSALDVLPTFAAIAGAKLPDDRTFDGMNQSAFFLGKTNKSERDNFYYYAKEELHAVRHGDWKLIIPHERFHGYVKDRGNPSEFELYNLKTDIGEKNNVIAQYPEVAERLKKIADRAKQEVTPDLPEVQVKVP